MYIRFKYEENVLEIVSLQQADILIHFFEMLAGQALNAISKLKSNLLKVPEIIIQQKFDLFNKSILPILYYGVKVWGLNEGIQSCTCLQNIF